ncbi:hypothetical protein OF846_000977 [Rhodotorula toruloides]|nr:hypothetical protein OF846_000977 [Rhodotorula toruloides]
MPFTSTLPDLLKCPACKNAAYPPYLLCASEHVRCSACAFTLYATDTCPDRGCAAAPLKLNVRRSPMLNRAFEAYNVGIPVVRGPDPPKTTKRTKQAAPSASHLARIAAGSTRRPISRLITRPALRSRSNAHKAARTAEGGRTMAGGRGVMPTHIDEECAQWTCRAVEGCETRTTRANLAKHEEGCSTDHENIKAFAREILRLRNAVDASTERCNALEEEKSDLTAKLAEEEKRRASMVTSSTSTDPVESSAATDKQSASINKGVLTSSSCANVDPAGQATKRSSRIAAKRRSSQAFADASDARPSPSRRNSVKPEPADA